MKWKEKAKNKHRKQAIQGVTRQMSAKQAENRQCRPSQCYSVTSSYRLNSSLQPGAVGTSRSNETFYVPEAEIIVEALDAEGPVGDPGYGSNSDGASTSLDSSALNFIHENGRVIRASLTVFASFRANLA